MIAQTNDSHAILFLSYQELQAAGLSPDGITGSQVLEFIQDTFVQADLPVPLTTEVELYSSLHGILLFLHAQPVPLGQFPLSSQIYS